MPGSVLAAFGIILLRNELKLFAKIKLAHHNRQDSFLKHKLERCPQIAAFVTHELTPDQAKKTRFDLYVTSFMIVLFLLSVGNALLLYSRWIPHIASP